MIKVLPYTKELLANFVYNGVDINIKGSYIIPVVEFYAKLGECYVGVVDNRVLMVGGVYPLWKDWGGCFLFLNKEGFQYKLSVFKIIKSYIEILVKKYGIKTLTVECIDGVMKAHRLIEHLGFQKNKEIKMMFYTKKEV